MNVRLRKNNVCNLIASLNDEALRSKLAFKNGVAVMPQFNTT